MSGRLLQPIKRSIKKAAVRLYRKVQKWDEAESAAVYEANWRIALQGKLAPELLEYVSGNRFAQAHGYPMPWDQPESFSEKILWMTLHYQNPLRICTNKFKMKGYVDAILGPGYTLPVIDWWTDPDDIEFEKLPDQFVLKVNNSSGHNIFVTDKGAIDAREIREKLRAWMLPANSGYYNVFSWAAKFSSPVIYAEDYLIPEGGVDSLYNYKLSCFGGKCKYIMGFSMREAGAGCAPAWYDRDFNRLPFVIGKSKKAAPMQSKPECLPEMIRLSEKLAEPFPYLRVDLYVVDGRILVGELTFSFGNGLETFNPDTYDFEIGKELELPEAMDFDRLTEFDPLSAQQAYLLDGRLPPDLTRRCLERKAFTSLLYWPNLENPRSLNEKLLWTALHWNGPQAKALADRCEMRRFVAEAVGERYLVPEIGVYSDANQIDWDALPERFAAKSGVNFGEGSVYLVRHRSCDSEAVFRATVGDWLLPWNSLYYRNACLPGRRAEPRILIEAWVGGEAKRLNEFRFYCVRGEAKLACAVCERGTARESCTFAEPDSWEALPLRLHGLHKRPSAAKPEKLAEMLRLCAALTRELPLARVDFFEVNGQVYVHNLSLDAALFQRIEPVEWDYRLGERFEI